TPGSACALMMLITNTLSQQFGLWPNYTGLVLSFLFGLVVFFAQSPVKWIARVLFYCLNSLIIFSVAMGTNQAGVASARAKDLTQPAQIVKQQLVEVPFFCNWLDGTVPRRKELVAEAQNLDD